MTISKSLLLLPAASLLIAAAIGAGACSSSVSISTSTPPGHPQLPPNVTLGGACSEQVYFADDSGYFFCNGDQWAYTTDVPAGYTEDTEYASYATDTFDSTDTDVTDTSDSTDSSHSETSDSESDTQGSSGTQESNTDTDTGSDSTGQQQG